jgi:cysteinyl-tRNA synthetase
MVPGRVNMYVCGMTVYDYCHLGHARVLVVFDMVCRWFRASGFEVDYVRNVTDVDDKIIKRAAENGEPIDRLTARFIDAMHRDAALLGVEPPSHEPRATRFVPAMVAMIETLVRRGLAYAADNGDVYYAVREFPGYGKLSGKSLEDLRAGERVEVEPHKRDPLDFVLWKAAKPGEPSWDSPWGKGRPGWHIECSVMSEHYLGEHFDIHGGGQDLQFPHHENEIAQSEGAHGHTFVNYWMHNGFVRVDNEKMSKSLGNFFTLDEVFQRFHPEVVRNFILTSHYRSPLNYTEQNLEQARADLDKLYFALRGLEPVACEPVAEFASRFEAAMDDDFNTPEARAVLADLANEINRARDAGEAGRAARLGHTLRELSTVLGLAQRDPEEYFQHYPGAGAAAVGGSAPVAVEEIEQLIAARTDARRRRDYAEADRIRSQLDTLGVEVQDGAEGTTWRWR